MLSVEGWVPSEMGVRREEEHLSSWTSMCKVSKAGRRATPSVVGWGSQGEEDGNGPGEILVFLGAKVESFSLCTLYPEQAHKCLNQFLLK